MRIPTLSGIRQIRRKCLDCSETIHEVAFCLVTDCPLWYLRFGTYPRTYIKNNGKKSRILFNPEAFEIDGIFSCSNNAAESRKIYQNLSLDASPVATKRSRS